MQMFFRFTGKHQAALRGQATEEFMFKLMDKMFC